MTINIDTETLRPPEWPRRHDTPPKVVRRDRIHSFFAWLAARSTSTNNHHKTIVVVCHYHVIRTALSSRSLSSMSSKHKNNNNRHYYYYNHNNNDIRPQNCEPIVCTMDQDGFLHLKKEQQSQSQKEQSQKEQTANK